jgi:hypothetical protein
MSFIFNAASIFPNVTVSQGDNLGIKIAGNNFAPYYHLEHRRNSTYCTTGWNNNKSCMSEARKFNHTLLEQGIGQMSAFGMNGEINLVLIRNTTVRFLVVVE